MKICFGKDAGSGEQSGFYLRKGASPINDWEPLRQDAIQGKVISGFSIDDEGYVVLELKNPGEVQPKIARVIRN